MPAPRNSNDLDTPVEFLSVTVSRDDAGGPSESWAVSGRGMARRELGGGSGSDSSDQEGGLASVVLWTRWRGDVGQTMRCRVWGQDYRILAADPEGRREWLRLSCERVARSTGSGQAQ